MRQRAMITLGFFGLFAVFLLLGLYLTTSTELQSIGAVSIGLAVLTIFGLIVFEISARIQPAWTKRLLQNGIESKATVIENNSIKGIGGYKGSDVWLDIPVRVEPVNEPPFETKMRCRLTQAIMLRDGGEVKVKYDPSNKSRAVLVGSELTDMMSKYMR